MRGYVGRCKHMARMFSIGKSKQNRDMWALELSNNPGASEAKPNARYVGNMHGDEPASRCLHISESHVVNHCPCIHIFHKSNHNVVTVSRVT